MPRSCAPIRRLPKRGSDGNGLGKLLIVYSQVKPATLFNPLRMFALSRAATSSVVVGQGDGPVAAGRLALAMRGLSGGQGKLATVPISNPDATSSVGSVVLWDEAAAADLFRSLGAR